MVNFSEMGLNVFQTSSQSSAVEYNLSLATPELSTPSSTPPVMPISISRMSFMGSIRFKYFAQIAMFSSSGSSERSSICDENNGSPAFAWNASSASSMPSNQG